jgi:hypothetical protein
LELAFRRCDRHDTFYGCVHRSFFTADTV